MFFRYLWSWCSSYRNAWSFLRCSSWHCWLRWFPQCLQYFQRLWLAWHHRQIQSVRRKRKQKQVEKFRLRNQNLIEEVEQPPWLQRFQLTLLHHFLLRFVSTVTFYKWYQDYGSSGTCWRTDGHESQFSFQSPRQLPVNDDETLVTWLKSENSTRVTLKFIPKRPKPNFANDCSSLVQRGCTRFNATSSGKRTSWEMLFSAFRKLIFCLFVWIFVFELEFRIRIYIEFT